MAERKEIYLDLPWDMVDECNGFGLDFGGSVVKIIYLHKDDWLEPDKRTKPNARLRLVNFARPDFEEAMKYLKKRVCIRRNTPDEQPLIYTTGVGGSQYSQKIRETFNIRTSNITEMECFFAAFNYIIKNYPITDIVHPHNQEAVQRAMKNAKVSLEFVDKVVEDSTNLSVEDASSDMNNFKVPQEKPYEEGKKFTDYKDLFPCFMVMTGSNGGTFVIKEEGSYGFAADFMRVGRVMLGLGSLLTGCKSYEELMSMAEKGNMRNVHEYLSDMAYGFDPSDKDNFYSAIVEHKDEYEMPGFLFGKCVFKDLSDFTKEDIAKAFVYTMTTDFVQTAYTPLFNHTEVRHVFFSGGYTNHPLMRDNIDELWIDRESQSVSMLGKKECTDTHFLKHGAHLGALGALLNQKLQFRVPKDTPK